MKLVHGGFTPEELAAFRSAIHRTVIDASRAIVLALRTSGLDVTLSEEQKHLTNVILCAKGEDALSRETANAIEALWRTRAVARLRDDEELNLPASEFYFLADIQRLARPEYTPTERDILRTPAQKQAITETRLNMGALSMRLIDVGPQCSERRKWIHCFESVTSIIFCTALSDYDQVLAEERGQNRMQESIILFSSIINSRWFLRTSIILFLTEIDVFKAKIHKVPLSNHFPEYTGGADINKAAKYILWRFMQENRARLCVRAPLSLGRDRTILVFLRRTFGPSTDAHTHSLTRANDTANVRLVFAAVKETILQNALKDSKVLETQVL
ncbi:Heterotrimeric G-protein alpha subunit [Mycena sanguinolenta]|uniref:Heterotrimeric G-protein alpha subunit n=1 Tax=Mycena sanguinolenta TaxID=230812 RepID=A0A8H6X488_9AGAR|nr:Heterotrimeric G-protein alpha subunit [Mycena sanguinolenta]